MNLDTELSSFIKQLSKGDTKTLTGKTLKTCEEVGELASVVLPFENSDGTKHRFVVRDQILEEVADTILSALSVGYHLDATDEELSEMLWLKAKKWSGLQASEAAAKFPVPFEIHLTVSNEINLASFHNVCTEIGNVKPIVLELQTRQKMIKDVMTTSRIVGDNTTAYREMERLILQFGQRGITCIRAKIETTPWHPSAVHTSDKGKNGYRAYFDHGQYFEAHVAVQTTDALLDKVQDACQRMNVHMSKNVFKKIDSEQYLIMCTMRTTTDPYEWFKGSVEAFTGILDGFGLTYRKPIIEFSLYDTNVTHDTEWING